jgi:hypothetical protein
MALYMFLHNFLNVLVEIANKVGLQEQTYAGTKSGNSQQGQISKVRLRLELTRPKYLK